MTQCKICNKNFKNPLALSIHFKTHKITSEEYWRRFLDKAETTCKICGKDRKWRKANKFNQCSDEKCRKKLIKFKHTDESKEKIRESRLRYLEKNSGKTAWERRADGKMSYLEKWFYNDVICKFSLDGRHKIYAEKRVASFLIDYAFVDEMIAVEIDGKCHFTNGNERVEKDKRKSDFLQEKGWYVYRIAYDEIKDRPAETTQRFLEFLERKSESSGTNVDEGYFLSRQETAALRRKQQEQKQQEKKDKKEKQIQERRDQILESGIDFSKYGWVNEVSKILGITGQATGRWIRRYMPDFYKQNNHRGVA